MHELFECKYYYFLKKKIMFKSPNKIRLQEKLSRYHHTYGAPDFAPDWTTDTAAKM
jgi:hypothetical protein